MRDQAESLRNKLKNLNNSSNTKTLAVVSGKGGVGKSNFSLNFSLGLSRAGHKVLLFDMDIGMGNINILMGVSAEHTIIDIFESELSLKEVITEGPEGLSFISGGSGFSKIYNLGEAGIHYFINQLESLFDEYDFIIFDMSAGVTEDSLQLALSADELIVVTTPEPTSITDAYSTIKFFSLKDQTLPIYIIVNKVHSLKETKMTINRLRKVVQQFLKKDISYLGDLPDDQTVTKAVRNQSPFLIYDPHSNVSKALLKILERYDKGAFNHSTGTSSFGFITKLKQFLLER